MWQPHQVGDCTRTQSCGVVEQRGVCAERWVGETGQMRGGGCCGTRRGPGGQLGLLPADVLTQLERRRSGGRQSGVRGGHERGSKWRKSWGIRRNLRDAAGIQPPLTGRGQMRGRGLWPVPLPPPAPHPRASPPDKMHPKGLGYVVLLGGIEHGCTVDAFGRHCVTCVVWRSVVS